MLEYIYKLNLPPLKNVVNINKLNDIISMTESFKNIHLLYPAEEIFLKDFLNIKDFNFQTASIFKKLNYTGVIHTDDQDTLKDENENPVWGINWVYNGISEIEYWERDKIEFFYKDENTIDSYHIMCKSKFPPSQQYLLSVDHPYLTNASIPHRATGHGARFLISLRTNSWTHPWPKLVDIFNDLII